MRTKSRSKWIAFVGWCWVTLCRRGSSPAQDVQGAVLAVTPVPVQFGMAKAAEVQGLTADDELRDAAVKILWTRFDEMWNFIDDVVKDFDADAVHDMRVASRRLRTAMQTFRPCFPRKTFKEHYERVRGVADALGEVRDRDVILDELQSDVDHLPLDQQSGVEALVETLRAEREGGRETLRAMLADLERSAYDREFLSYLARSS